MFYCFIRPQEAVLFQKNLKFLKSPILDFGCGDGFFTEVIFGKQKIDIGLDIKSSRINEAKEKQIYKKTIVYDGQTIPFPDNHFTSVISNCVLEHLSRLEDCLKEIHRVLKPGAYFLTTVMTEKWENYLLGKKIFGKYYVNYMRKKQKHHNLLSVNKWQTVFEKAGFKIAKKTGYLSPTASRYLELYHYLSIPSLINYKLFKKWSFPPSFYPPITMFRNIVKKKTSLNKSAAVFFVLKK